MILRMTDTRFFNFYSLFSTKIASFFFTGKNNISSLFHNDNGSRSVSRHIALFVCQTDLSIFHAKDTVRVSFAQISPLY